MYRPFLKHFSWMFLVSSGIGSLPFLVLTSSRPSTPPRPRTSPSTAISSFHSLRRLNSTLLIIFVLGRAFFVNLIDSRAPAQQTGLPPNVPPRLAGPGADMISSFPVTPPRGTPNDRPR